MARILLDNDVPHSVANLLRAQSYNVVTASEIGKAAALDDELHLIAAQQGQLLITHNAAQFALLHDAWLRWFRAYGVQPTPLHAGILVIPQPDYGRGYWLPDLAAREIDAFLARSMPLDNQLCRWSASRGWLLRRSPFSTP